MIHTYRVLGMTCGGCEAAVKSKLLALPEITAVEASKDTQTATITLEKHTTLAQLQEALGGSGAKYQISALQTHQTAPIHQTNQETQEVKSWVKTYKPILLIFGLVALVACVLQINNNAFDFMAWMRHFMAGFFLIFSFFKLLDLKGFAQSYAMYDVVAKRFPAWGYVYPFVELGLGLAFCINYEPKIVNIITLLVMTVSIVGVLQSVLNKRKIQCACLGAVFKLPMSTVTIVEDALMMGMSGAMLFFMNT